MKPEVWVVEYALAERRKTRLGLDAAEAAGQAARLAHGRPAAGRLGRQAWRRGRDPGEPRTYTAHGGGPCPKCKCLREVTR